ncbi:hypothetical protein [Spiroplasma endosymbiont of Nebria brevicollis]|uniref:hypothetical protein n=1 Tax=Spiroplasma endosymbiont of Nebria brevicollis TaxID=3066284 RepID=UPI00313CBB86
MRKLLSLLTVLTVTTPVPLNVMACGWTKPPVVDETDYFALAQTAQEKIQTEFANLVNDGLNLRKESDVTDGGDILTYLQGIGQAGDTVITENDDPVTFHGFLEVLNQQVSTTLMEKYPELKPLFNGINPNEILKINTNGLKLTNKEFEWEIKKFGLEKFDAKNDYGVTDWYYLITNLELDFTCLGENAKVNTTTIKQSFDMYFANDDSNLNQIVKVVSANIEDKVTKLGPIKLEYPEWN